MHDAVEAIRTGNRESRGLSRQDWVDEGAGRRLDSLDREVWERCEPFTPLLLFVGGSAIHGELCGIVRPDGSRLFLSDLDVGILTERRVPRHVREQIDRPVGVVEIVSKVGFYCREEMGRQHPTPGLVETAAAGICVRGSRRLMARFAMPPPRAIPVWETRRLLGNRVLEWIGAVAPVARVYAAAKLASDLTTIALISRGRFAGGGYAERLRAFETLDEIDPETRLRVGRWVGWRLAPGWTSVPTYGSVEAAVEGDGLVRDVESLTLDGLRLAGVGDSIGAFLSDAPIGVRTRLRSWRRWRSNGGRGIGLLRSTLSPTPRTCVWQAALARTLGREDEETRAREALFGNRASERNWITSAAERLDAEGID